MFRLLLAIPLIFVLSSCTDSDSDPQTSTDVLADSDTTHDPLHEAIEHACLHFVTGTAVEVSAAATQNTAPTVAVGHERFHVTFTAFDSEQGGFVKLTMAEAGHLIVMLSATLPLTAEDASGTAVAIHEQIDQPDACDSVAKAVVFEVETAGDVFLRFGPAALTEVQMVLETEDDHHSHDITE